MKIPFEWLSEFVDLHEYTPEELSEQISLKAFEVEDIEYVGAKISGTVVSGKILEIAKHPNADKLQITKTQIAPNEEPRQIVCGAKNIAVGQIIPVALPGAIVLNRTNGEPLPIKVGKIRDVESQGMLCSGAELGLDGDEGIFILEPTTPVGENLIEKLNLKPKAILNVASRSNRGDALSLQGIAREVAATTNKALQLDYCKKDFKTTFVQTTQNLNELRVVVDPKICYEIGFLKVVGVKIGTSPSWLSDRLKAAGISSINNIVDVTNYVMLELGQPMHAYDANKLNFAEALKVSLARQTSENFKALDGNEYKLSSDNLVIENNDKVLSLAGVMGGAESAINENTSDILLEAACFEPKTVRRSSRLSGISTESSRRFERGTDPVLVKIALMRALELICKVAGGKPEAYALATAEAQNISQIELSFARYKELIGQDISFQLAQNIFEKLGFKINKITETSVWVEVPSFRLKDITRPIDLIEELARFQGFNNIVAQPLPGVQNFLAVDKTFINLKKALVNQGLLENISSSLVSDTYELSSAEVIKMRNPLSREHTQLRTNLLIGLLKAGTLNYRRQQNSIGLFEFGKAYTKLPIAPTDEHSTGTQENDLLGILLSEKTKELNWQRAQSSKVDFYHLKGLIEFLCLKKGKLVFNQEKNQTYNFLHPAAWALINLNGKNIGYLGQIHPLTAKEYELPENTFVGEIQMAPLLAKSKLKLKPLNDNPSLQRDFTVDLPAAGSQVSFESIQKVMIACKLANLEDISLVSIYNNPKTAINSLSYRLTFQAQSESLTGEEINKKIVELKTALARQLPAISFRD
jgi:phenylalanyl-tRNA synthetase beta chain